MPPEMVSEFNTYHTFVIQVENRDRLKKLLEDDGIETSIHYPLPIHLQPASAYLGYKCGDFPVTEKQSQHILTLPINQYIESSDIERIAQRVNFLVKK